MAAPDVEFMTKECRAVMKFLFLKGKGAKKIHDDMSVTLRKKSLSYSTGINCVAQFKTGHFSTEDEDSPGRPLVVTVPENMDPIHSIDLGGLKNFSQKGSRDSGDISEMCTVHHP
jgi:hypothetical protein